MAPLVSSYDMHQGGEGIYLRKQKQGEEVGDIDGEQEGGKPTGDCAVPDEGQEDEVNGDHDGQGKLCYVRVN